MLERDDLQQPGELTSVRKAIKGRALIMWSHRTLALLLTSLCVGTLLAGETEVRQGDVGSDLSYRSPMLIETDLNLDWGSDGAWVLTNEFEKYVCDSVRLKELATRVTYKPYYVQIDLRVRTFTEPGQDKTVRIEFELFTPEGTVATGTLPAINAEEKKQGMGYLTIKVPGERWPVEGPLRLHISLSAVDD